MQQFLTLAGQLFVIICIQSVLEVMISSRRQNHLHKIIFLACYLSSLLLVLNFMYQQINPMISRLFYTFL